MSLFAPKAGTAFDPALASLFASSAGPVAAPVKRSATRTSSRQSKSTANTGATTTDASRLEAESSSSEDEESADEGVKLNGSATKSKDAADRPRKRRKLDENDELEGAYLDKLSREEEVEHKKQKEAKKRAERYARDEDESASDDSDLDSNLEDISESEQESDSDGEEAEEPDRVPVHESLTDEKHELEAGKMKRTVFLGNVSIDALKSKSAKKTLLSHIESAIDTKHHEKVESIRFRSTAFVSDAGPKRAAYAKKELMEETMKSTNAYVVMSSDAAARKVAMRLNGTEILGRHMRVDNLGQPARIDNKRCVFVGNLSFVDTETVTEETEEGTKKRPKAKEPADVEEGLWRTFSKAGKVQNVRVIRDKETRISKGFAYVQFEDENGVEAALAYNDKKFPPMLPRKLRVMRAKRILRSEKRERDRGAKAGTKRKFDPSRARDARSSRRGDGEKLIFEGHRASTANAPRMLKKSKKKRAPVRPNNRSSRRAASFKASGGKKKRDE